MSTGGEQSVTRALDSLDGTVRALRGAAESIEVFVRWSDRLHVELDQGAARVSRGAEAGTAVRLRDADGSLRFGASSGGDEQAAARALATARSLPGCPAAEGGDPWAGEGLQVDRAGPLDLPDPAEAEAWLRSAWERTPGGPGARAHLDAAVTVEALGTTGGLRTCRLRGVVWARWVAGTAVRSAVSRRLPELEPAGWDEPSVALAPALPPVVGGPIALLPAAAGSLAPVLVAAVHPPGVGAGKVGPGWVCEDDPGDPEAPAGGAFDDTGFPGGRLPLADGRRILATPAGPGRRRRLSFRHPPVERAANLCFRPTGSWDGTGLVVRGARPHAVGGSWWTVLEAAPAREGRLLAPWSAWGVRAGPEAWVAGCRAGVGPARRSPEGVLTPTLVFDGLHAERLPG